MIKSYEPCIINRNDTLNQLIKKINLLKKNDRYYPVGIYLKNNKVFGILSLGDIRRLSLKKVNVNKPAVKYLNRRFSNIHPSLFNSNLNNKLNDLIKKKRFDFIITNINSEIKIIKISDLRNQQKYRMTCVIGLGHIGLPLMVHLLNKINHIIGYDKSKKVINNLKRNKISFHEKNLKSFLKQNLVNKKVSFFSDISKIKAQNYIVCLGSEIKKKKISNENLSVIFKKIAKSLNPGDLVILRGTVQVGLCNKLLIPILEKNSSLICGKDFNFAFMPERIIEGDALNELKTLPQLISGKSDLCKEKSLNFAKFYFDKIIELSTLEEAEIIKLATNSFRDLNFAFANEVTRIASKFNLSGNQLIKNSNLGYSRNRISMPSIGVGGYCLPKDPILFTKLYKISDGYKLGLSSRNINNRNIYETYKKLMINKKRYKKILIFGATFKGLPETIDLRNSPAIEISNLLKNKAKKIEFYDVKQKNIQKVYEKLPIKFVKNLRKINDYDLIILANNHPNYVEIIEGEYGIGLNKKKYNKCIFDPWCLLNKELIQKFNWKYLSL